MLLVGGVLMVVVVAAVVAYWTLGPGGPADAVPAPAAPADLCAVVGRERLAEWVPNGEAEATRDDATQNTESSCASRTPDGQATGPEGYASFDVRVYRFGDFADTGVEQATRSIESSCAGAPGADPGLGDASCSRLSADDDDEVPNLRFEVRQGADLVMISYYSSTIDLPEARARLVTATDAVLEELEG